jgi:hypothetical protein
MPGALSPSSVHRARLSGALGGDSTCFCSCLQAKGPTAYPNNAAFVAEYTVGLLSTSFPNMTQMQIQAAVAGMMAIEDKRAFKHHMRDFLVQVRSACLYCCAVSYVFRGVKCESSPANVTILQECWCRLAVYSC